MSLFVSRVELGCMVVACPSSVEALSFKHFALFSVKWLENPVSGYIFDFGTVVEFDKQGYALFKKFKQDAQISKRPVFSINVKKEIKAQFSKDGVDLLFNICDTPATAFKNLGIEIKVAKKIDVTVINALIEIVGAEVKKSMQMDVTRGTPFLKKSMAFEGAGIIAIILLSGPSVNGLVRLLMPEDFTIGLHRHIYGDAVSIISDEVVNYMNNFTAEIFKNIRSKLFEGDIDVGEAFPSIFVGKPSEIVTPRQEVSIVVPFEVSVGKFFLEVVTSS